ncbi:cytochrome P450 [Coprinopsis marcescibilis]|uniref:Cytochrome P450 n=1 Tax=Coprinopsis marcescibilis TaxID=230819 RepID=A0A5C3KG90_COPMA|nr:cytochrome P450 [Coprinopsis marcescibilis]
MGVFLRIVGALFATWCVRTVLYLIRVRRFPPGPPRPILLDNRGDMAFKQNWKAFHDWNKKYGSIISFYLGRKPLVVLGSLDAVTDLLEKKGNIYSSRPRFIVAGEILCRNMRGLGMPYGQRWRNWRSLMHASMSIEASAAYKPLQSAETKIMLRDILQNQDSPEKFPDFIRRYAVSVVTVVAYGRRIKTLEDHLVVKQQKIDEYYINSTVPGKFLVEIFPILTWLPKSLQWYRREPEEHYKKDVALLTELMEEVRERMKKGLAYPSTATRALEKQGAFGLDDLETAYALASPFGAGAGTTLATLDFFLLAMLIHPEAMRKAHEELDRVIGRDRLPEYDDRDSLPYVNALIKEIMRWRPIAPIAVPHSVIADDEYKGHFIPKGTTVIGSIYSITQNEEMFPDPETFRPDRYIENPKLPNSFVFGFGRRVCPGMHVAQNSLFSIVSKMLWAYEILPTKDSQGKPIIPSKDDIIPALVIKPKPFNFLLVPRHGNVAAIVTEEARKADVELAAYE